MTAVALISGMLFKAAEQRMSKNGNQFVTATLKAKDGDGWQYWRLTAFNSDAQAELMRLASGDAVSVQGLMRAELYEAPDKPPRVSLSLVVDQALAARPKPRKKDDRPKPGNASANRSYADQSLNDEVGF